MDWKTFIIFLLAIIVIALICLAYIGGKFGLYDKEDLFNGSKKQKDKTPRDKTHNNSHPDKHGSDKGKN